MTKLRGRLTAPLAIALTAGFACTDAATDPSAIAALDFTGVAFPAVVSGDTLRNRDGVATPLSATVYNGRGDVIPDAAVTFFSLDSGVSIDGNGYLVATRRSGAVRLVASLNGLQSQPRTVQAVRAPDTVVAPATTVGFPYAIPDRATNLSAALSLTLRTSDTSGGLAEAVPGWLVRWRILHDGDTVAVTDTSKVALWPASASRHSLLDTTKTDGVSSRRLRIYANALPVRVDSFIVIAEVRSRGAHVPGSPVRYVVTITPPTF